MQKIIDVPIKNDLWDNPQYYAEEQLSGIQVIFRVTEKQNIIESKDGSLQHSFQEYRDMKLYDVLGDTAFTAVLTAPEGMGRKYLKTLIHSGVMGSEKLQHQNGSIRLVLTDLHMFRGIELTGFSFKERRIYLESLTSLLLERGFVPSILISDIIKTDKKQFFDFICERGARGIILKHCDGLAEDNVFKVTSPAGGGIGVGNVTLNKGWQSLKKKTEPLEEFDFNTFLAIQFLTRPNNEKLLSSITS